MTEPACAHRRFGEPCISCRSKPAETPSAQCEESWAHDPHEGCEGVPECRIDRCKRGVVPEYNSTKCCLTCGIMPESVHLAFCRRRHRVFDDEPCNESPCVCCWPDCTTRNLPEATT